LKTFPKPLSSKEEAYYIALLKGQPQEVAEAKEVLIQRNMRLIAHIIKKYQNTGEEMEDLISIGTIGLIKAIDSFDASKGQLATYACRCIDNELLMMLRAKKKSSREVSLYEPIGTDKEGNEINLLDVLEQPWPDVVEQMDLRERLNKMFEVFDRILTQREKQILIMRYGLAGREFTQQEVGEILGISRSYVSRIEKKTLGKLKNTLNRET
jgi:RNA polymerase sporulation-specific sigma factor